MTRRIRPATREDATAIRRLVTEALLAAGFAPPDPDRDRDLLDLSEYAAPGNGMSELKMSQWIFHSPSLFFDTFIHLP